METTSGRKQVGRRMLKRSAGYGSDQGIRPLLRHQVAGSANQVDSFVAAFGLHLSHHAPDVVLYRKFRQIKTGGDFLVREALRN